VHGGYSAGGIAGYNGDGTAIGLINGAAAFSAVFGGNWSGGVVGQNWNFSFVANSFIRGVIYGTYTAGIAAVNYGAIGVVIGHEITHGYDDQGRQYDAEGNLHDWWTEADAKEFKGRAQKLVDQYNGYEALPGQHVNGQLTLGENIADLGGTSIAYEALQRALAKDPAKRKIIDGYTPEQRFYLSLAQLWRTNWREAELRRRLVVDPHSPGQFRANGSQRSQEIRARADRDVTVLLAEATSTSEKTRGEGDATRNNIFAEAYSKDVDFFSFYRSMQAYENGLRHNDTRLVIKPDSEFFRYFSDPSGKAKPKTATP
jgi:hypothetical protein